MAGLDDKETRRVGRRPVPKDEKKERCTFSISKSVKELFFKACDKDLCDPNRTIEALMLDYYESQGGSLGLEEKLRAKKAELSRLENDCKKIEGRLNEVKEIEKASATRLKNDLYLAEIIGVALRAKANPRQAESIPQTARKLALKYGFLTHDVANDINTVLAKELVMPAGKSSTG